MAAITVVVISYERRDDLLRTLAHLTALPDDAPVVVVDNGSRDGTAAAVRAEFPDVELIALDRNLGAAGRNVAVARATTPYVAFADDDSWWHPGSLTRAVELFDAHPRLGLVNARIVVEPRGELDPIAREMSRSPLADPGGLPGTPILSFLAGASAVRRDAFLEVGGFEERFFLGGEEELLGADLAAAGWHLRYVPELVVHHHASSARDRDGRRAQGIRNTLWFTWLRRPLPSAARRTAQLLRQFPADATAARGVAAALAGLPWVLRERRPLPLHVERGLRRLERQQDASEARQYHH